MSKCKACNGAGKITCFICKGTGITQEGHLKGQKCYYCQGRDKCKMTCPVCKGSGKIKESIEEIVPCEHCKGMGKVKCYSCKGRKTAGAVCNNCFDNGKLQCWPCKGTGKRIRIKLAKRKQVRHINGGVCRIDGTKLRSRLKGWR